MKTNLIFKKQIVVDGTTQVITRIIPVEVPNIESGQGWILSGHSDVIEVFNDNVVNVVSNNTQQSVNTTKKEENSASFGNKFISDVSGTAKLVRSGGVIKIVARRGKSTYNQTTPNSICISDITKNEFFKHCREYFGNSAGIFEFDELHTKPYQYWNEFIDKEYIRQKERSNNN